MILAADIGGTKTNIALFELEGGALRAVAEAKFPSGEHKSLGEIVAKFQVANRQTVARACFGVAGPVKNGRCEATNLPWIVDSSDLAAQLGIPSVGLINDLEANAYGIAALRAEDFAVLNPGAAGAEGNAAVIAAGTGLGEAYLYWDGRRHRPVACEGGHSDFAPRNEVEMELLRYLLKRFPHVSYERVLSGPGLFNVYSFVRDSGKFGSEPGWLAEKIAEGNPAAAVSESALAGTCEIAAQALALFVSIYGAEAGNLALKIMSTGGVFVGGGVAPRIIGKMTDGTFMRAFVDKGRLGRLMEAIPVRVILNDKTALIGAARYAAMQIETGGAD
ncbi:MAG: glucokinase [Deltaproteobacteria bacterium]